jgi:hypothetical protein
MSHINASRTICLVAILKDEERFLDEWLIYHRMIGIDHFFLYDNDPAQPLKDYLVSHSDYLTIINYWQLNDAVKSNQDAQLYAYTHALNNYIISFEWVTFIDADEFIVLKQHSSIKEFLSDFRDEVSISLNWHLFGHNGFFNDPQRLITSSLNRRMLMPFPDVKTITKTAVIADVTSAHYCILKYGNRVDANHREYTNELYEGKTDVAHINHYYCRSFKTWMRRIERGNVNIQPKQEIDWKKQNTDITYELFLERFVHLIARDKNEHTDNFMLQYKYDIHESINKLTRVRGFSFKDFLTEGQEITIKEKLKQIAQCLSLKAKTIHNIGLLRGKSGIAVFLFHYSSFTNDLKYNEIASKILDDIADEITENSIINCSDGLAGYGIAIEYLVSESYIKIDTNEFLQDLDVLISYYLTHHTLPHAHFYKELPGLGKYFLSRADNPFNDPHHHREPQNRNALLYIAQIKSSNNHKENLTDLNFLYESYNHKENQLEAIEFIKQKTSKLTKLINNNETIIFENFSLLYFVKILIKVSIKTKEEYYYNLANDMLQRFENDYWQYLNNSKQSSHFKFYAGMYYLQLAKMFNKTIFIKKGLHFLDEAIEEIDNLMPFSSTNDLRKILGYGLAFLTVLAPWKESLVDLTLSFAPDLDS